ncbi:ABC transporter ATP-binding protein [Sphaerochaeta halotolerans]|uniref:ABC transporter ATP-binding protein n=1 Tax=Sphaerochaeta halotolerans TaxID=2293840 RepID=UPI00136E3D3F|nr:ABC transporter ATP-binding protein [Sphaerochaeta halotolerans]MXI85438.1 ATP-binding cassette domain-containing protein [Sphaerochaeta halotolerans]
MDKALSVQNITKRFGDFTAVNQVSFDVEDGKFFSILGPSGCGKTTLLRMIAGFYKPDGGTLLFNGKNMDGVAPNKRPVNLVFQNLALFPMMNVHENIAFGLRRRGEKGPGVDKKVRELLERVGLPESGKKQISQLSGGQKQRIAIARCLIMEPTVLLLDEPLGALDAKLREHMKVELKNLQSQVGTTFVYITHDQSEAMVMSDMVAVMNNGHFEQIGTPQELYHEPKSSFVAQFVGNNNKLRVKLHADSSGNTIARYADRYDFKLAQKLETANENEEYDLFIRPEAVIINPGDGRENFHVLPVDVTSILFDGGNSRLLVQPLGTEEELVIALPQTREYDHIRSKDRIQIGWDMNKTVCFKRSDWKLYDEE